MTRLWQPADIKCRGAPLDPDAGAEFLADFAREGYDAFDMAEHVGSTELIAGRLLDRFDGEETARPRVLAKWAPEPGRMTADEVRASIERRLRAVLARCSFTSDRSSIPTMSMPWANSSNCIGSG